MKTKHIYVRSTFPYNWLSPSKWLLSFLLSAAFFLLHVSVAKAQSKASVQARLSPSSRYLSQRLSSSQFDWNRFKTRKRAFNSLPNTQLVLSANDVLLFSNEVESRRLFFTRLYFDRQGRLEEIKYFFFGSYPQLSAEFSPLRNRMRRALGVPAMHSNRQELTQTV
ncbi:MAG: hypothetical protein AAFO94_11830, partial [Bacteroidota bacterium]